MALAEVVLMGSRFISAKASGRGKRMRSDLWASFKAQRKVSCQLHLSQCALNQPAEL